MNKIEFYKETEFKETPIGKIPKDWEVINICDYVNILKGFAFSSEYFNEKKEGMPLIRIRDLGKSETESYYSGPFDPTYIVQKGDILVSMDGEFNAHIWNGSPGLLNQRICKIYPKDYSKLSAFFLYYQIQKPLKLIEKQISQTTVKHLLDKDIERIRIPLPSIVEQRAIAEVLSVVDLAIQRTDMVIAKTERLKRGLMQELLTRGIGHKEFKDTEIGRIPKNWEVVRLGNIAEVWDKYRVPVKEQDRRKGKYPYCGANGVIDYIDGYTHDGVFVLLAEDGGFFGPYENSAYIMHSKFWANNHVHILKVTEERATNEFFMFYLNFMDLRPFLTGSTRPKLTQGDMIRIPIPLPPLPEQQKIAEILSTVDKKLELERSGKARLEIIKQGLMDLLLTGKVRIRVDMR
ncbi:MAG: restriction endonuclease subunit S [Nitrososphaerota archaeon]